MSLTSIAFLLSFLGGIILSFLRNPIFGLITYVLVLYLSPHLRWWYQGLPDLRWSFLAGTMVLIGVLVHANRLELRKGFFSSPGFWITALILFLIILQCPIAISLELHLVLIVLMIKYMVIMYLIYITMIDERALKILFFTVVVGSWYWGWLAFTQYTGGRFETFGADVDSNGAGVMLAVGTFLASSLLLTCNWWQRLMLIAGIPFILNGLITTLSRGAFLAVFCGGIAYVVLSPKRYRGWVAVLSILALILFLYLTNEQYWERISTLLKILGERENLDTIAVGSGRLDLIFAQLEMLKSYPWGTGHKGTMILSPAYMPVEMLTEGRRSSHNTFMSFLVDHGPLGAILYCLLTGWCFLAVLRAYMATKHLTNFYAVMVPSLGAAFVTFTVADMTVNYLKLEIRYWIVAVLMVLLHQIKQFQNLPQVQSTTAPKSLRPRSYLDWNQP